MMQALPHAPCLPMNATEPPTAAIVSDGSANVDALLDDVARHLLQQGWRVRGLLMTYPQPERGCAGVMTLVDLATGDEYPASQDLGGASNACRADPQGFARASQVLRRAAEEGADLVIVNRFGSLEAAGGGFRTELLDLMAQGRPLLTAVASRFLPDWERFSGGTPLLPARREAVDAWLAGLPQPRPCPA